MVPDAARYGANAGSLITLVNLLTDVNDVQGFDVVDFKSITVVAS